jgi:hypothetical protein
MAIKVCLSGVQHPAPKEKKRSFKVIFVQKLLERKA